MKKTILILLVCMVSLLSCSKKQEPVLPLDEEILPAISKEEMQDIAVEEFLDSLATPERLSLIFLVNVEGNEKYRAVESLDGSPLVPGGMLFFSYNIADDAEKMIEFTDSVYSFCEENGIASLPYIALDQEGGYVNRLRGITSTLPSAKKVASTVTADEAFLLYQSQARQMRLLGFTVNLSPVVEIETEENREFLDTRSFGDAEKVALYAAKQVSAYEGQSVSCVLKHFPGNTNTDPHTGLPEISLAYEKVFELLVEPFKNVLDASPVSAVLMSHARVSAVDGDTPACLSRVWVNDILCTALDFDGLVLSDDIFMAALEKNGYSPEDAALQAINAGVDVIMLSEKRFEKVAVFLDEYSKTDGEFLARLREAQKKVIRYKIKLGLLNFTQNEDGSYKVIPSPEYAKENVSKTKQTRLNDFKDEKRNGEELYASLFLEGSR